MNCFSENGEFFFEKLLAKFRHFFKYSSCIFKIVESIKMLNNTDSYSSCSKSKKPELIAEKQPSQNKISISPPLKK